MIIDHIDNAELYSSLNPAFAQAFAFLRQPNIDSFNEGSREIDGKKVFAIGAVGKGGSKEGARIEAHRKYIDIQYTLSGIECIGWRAVLDCKSLDTAYSEENDAILYSDRPATWTDIPGGHFAVYFPSDGHAPMCGEGGVHKIIVKVAVA